MGCDGVEVLLHRCPVLVNDAGVAGLQPGGPGDDDASIAPSGGEAGVLPGGAWGVNAEVRGGGLRAAHVAAELAGECGEVHVVGSGAPENFGVAHPTQALVALRAVSRDADEVAALAPENVAPKLIDEWAACF